MSDLKAALAARAKLEADLKEALEKKEAAFAEARSASGAGAKAAAEGRAGMAEQMAVALKIKLKDSEAAVAAARANAKKHTVAAGETLSHIALKHYGKANEWRELYELNKDVIGDDPGKIKPGMELIIP
jgi:nucleoid-associated protein YgaU